MYHLLRIKKQGLIGVAAVYFFVLFAGTATAQLRDNINLPNSDERAYHIGIVIMGASGRFQLNQHPRFLQNDSVLSVFPENNAGLGIGGMHTFRISDHFEARVVFPQLLFVNKVINYELKYPDQSKGESRFTKKTIESILLGIPVQLKFRSDRINNFRVYMMGGFKIEADLASKARAKSAEDLIKLKSFDYGIEGGIGFNFYMRYFMLSPEIKFSNGLQNVHSRDANLKFSSVIDKIQSRQIIFSLIFEG
jgi:Outer membrane protein beta-barrel domain